MHAATSSLEMNIFSPLEIAFAKQVLQDFTKENEEEAFFLSFLFAASLEGHLCTSLKEKLSPDPSFLWEREGKERKEKIEEKIIAGFRKLLLQKDSFFSPLIRFEEDRAYLSKNYFFETKIVDQLSQRLQAKPKELFHREIFFSELQRCVGEKQLQKEQVEAIEKGFDMSLSLIVGGPGTGKTFTASIMIALFSLSFAHEQKKQLRVALTAPTGRAADHLKEAVLKHLPPQASLELVSSTLHSLLKIREDRPFAAKSFCADVIIVDESSMIDPTLMASLLASSLPTSRLILMGDSHQLPAIEGGSIFFEMAKKESWKGKNFATLLKKPMRFENEEILLFSQAVLEGDLKKGLNRDDKGVSFLFSEEKEMQERFFLEGASFFSPPFVGDVDLSACFAHMQTLRLLSPLRNTKNGVDAYNQRFLCHLMHQLSLGQEAVIPVLITRNDTDKKLSNGTLGMIKTYYRKEKAFPHFSDLVYFWNAKEATMRSFPLSSLGSYEYGYCLSVHKSQGNEFSKVVLLLPPGSEIFGKEMLYTAATRAKKSLLVMGSKKTIEELFKKESLKSSGILEKLRLLEKENL